jgi:hypothetical protein
LINQGFCDSKCDSCLFIKKTNKYYIYILIDVDDIIVIGSCNEEVQNIIKTLGRVFAIQDLGRLHYFLGIEVKESKNQLLLSQSKYVVDILKRFKLHESKPYGTPMASSIKLTHSQGDILKDLTKFQSLVRAL